MARPSFLLPGHAVVPGIAAFVTFVVGLLVLEAGALEAAFEHDELRALSSVDDWRWCAKKVRDFDPGGVPTVVALGGSSLREALVPDEQLTRRLSERAGHDVRFLSLATSSQTPTETLAMMSQLKLAPGSLVIVNITEGRLLRGWEEARREAADARVPFTPYAPIAEVFERLGQDPPLTRPTLRREREWLRARYELLVKERFRQGYLSRMLRRADLATCGLAIGCGIMLLGQAPENPPRFKRYRYHTHREARRLARKFQGEIEKGMDTLKENIPFHVAVLEEIKERAEAQGARLVLLDLPHNPLIDGLAARIDKLWSGARRPLEEAGMIYLDIGQEGFVPTMFRDHTHQIAAGRRITSDRFVEMIGGLLAGQAPSARGG